MMLSSYSVVVAVVAVGTCDVCDMADPSRTLPLPVRGGLHVSEAVGVGVCVGTAMLAMSAMLAMLAMLGSLSWSASASASIAARSRLDRGPRRLTCRLYVQAMPPSVQRVHGVPSIPGWHYNVSL